MVQEQSLGEHCNTKALPLKKKKKPRIINGVKSCRQIKSVSVVTFPVSMFCATSLSTFSRAVSLELNYS